MKPTELFATLMLLVIPFLSPAQCDLGGNPPSCDNISILSDPANMEVLRDENFSTVPLGPDVTRNRYNYHDGGSMGGLDYNNDNFHDQWLDLYTPSTGGVDGTHALIIYAHAGGATAYADNIVNLANDALGETEPILFLSWESADWIPNSPEPDMSDADFNNDGSPDFVPRDYWQATNEDFRRVLDWVNVGLSNPLLSLVNPSRIFIAGESRGAVMSFYELPVVTQGLNFDIAGAYFRSAFADPSWWGSQAFAQTGNCCFPNPGEYVTPNYPDLVLSYNVAPGWLSTTGNVVDPNYDIHDPLNGLDVKSMYDCLGLKCRVRHTDFGGGPCGFWRQDLRSFVGDNSNYQSLFTSDPIAACNAVPSNFDDFYFEQTGQPTIDFFPNNNKCKFRIEIDGSEVLQVVNANTTGTQAYAQQPLYVTGVCRFGNALNSTEKDPLECDPPSMRTDFGFTISDPTVQSFGTGLGLYIPNSQGTDPYILACQSNLTIGGQPLKFLQDQWYWAEVMFEVPPGQFENDPREHGYRTPWSQTLFFQGTCFACERRLPEELKAPVVTMQAGMISVVVPNAVDFPVSIEVLSTDGRLLAKTSQIGHDGSIVFDMKDQANSLYLVTIRSGESQWVERVFKHD